MTSDIGSRLGQSGVLMGTDEVGDEVGQDFGLKGVTGEDEEGTTKSR